MNYYKLFFILSIYVSFVSCNNSNKCNSKTDSQIKDLILKNNKNQLFLNFWSGMTKCEFSQLINYSNKNDDLVDGQFLLKVKPIRKSIKKYEDVYFNVSMPHSNLIMLEYEDEYLTPYTCCSATSANDGRQKSLAYRNIKTELNNVFNEQYYYSDSLSSNYDDIWIDTTAQNCRIIRLYSSIWSFNYNDIGSNSIFLTEDKKFVWSANGLLRISFYSCDYYYAKILTEMEDEKKKLEQIEIDKNNAKNNNKRL